MGKMKTLVNKMMGLNRLCGIAFVTLLVVQVGPVCAHLLQKSADWLVKSRLALTFWPPYVILLYPVIDNIRTAHFPQLNYLENTLATQYWTKHEQM